MQIFFAVHVPNEHVSDNLISIPAPDINRVGSMIRRRVVKHYAVGPDG